MAIVIPSKNIYELDNNKIRSNIIKSVGSTINNTSVYFDENAFTYSPEISISENPYNISVMDRRCEQWYMDIYYVFKPNISIKNISLSIQYKTIVNRLVSFKTIQQSVLESQNPIKESLDLSGASFFDFETNSVPELYLIDVDTYPKDFSVPIKIEQISGNAYILSGKIRVKTTTAYNGSGGTSFEGNYEESILDSVVIKIKGDAVSVDEVSKIYPESSDKSDIVLNTNELFQETTKTHGEPTWSYISRNVIDKYKNGKETATLRCSISDYYDENGEKVIDIKGERKSFHIQDKVIPMVYGADGKDQPMSKIGVSEPKVFEVVGSKIFYDGAVWQTITIQEA
jgi:hypothetical protein